LISALGAFLGIYVMSLASSLPILTPFAQMICSPLAAVDNYFWPDRWVFYTPYSSHTEGGLPRWVGWLWLLSVAYLLGALTGRAAQRLFQRLRNQG
jgi:putative flippase GtrA